MINIKLERALERKPITSFIVCKDKKFKSGTRGVIECKYTFSTDEEREYDITSEEREYINSLLNTNPRKAVELMIEAQLKGEQITSYNRGSSYYLPTRFQRFYKNSVAFKTESSQIFFADKSLIVFSDFIERLKNRNQTDTVQFVVDKIRSKKSQHACIRVSNMQTMGDSRYAYLDEDELHLSLWPKDAVYYSTNIDDTTQYLDSTEKILDAFTEIYGLFDFIKWNSEECVAYNQHSLKISGLDIDSSLLQKVLTYQKGGK